MFNCELCHYTTDRSSNFKKHFETKKHIVNAHYESKKNNTCDFICSLPEKMGTLVPKTCVQIENIEKNAQKKGEKFMEKTTKLSNERYISGTIVPKTTKLSNERYILGTMVPIDNIDDDKFNEIININGEIRFQCEQCKKTFGTS